MQSTIWIDMINPSHPLFFKPVIEILSKVYDITVSIRDRGETIGLTEKFKIDGVIYGKDYENSFLKTGSIITRTIHMSIKIPTFDFALSFENPMSVGVAKIRNRKSILMLDNDLKYKIRGNFIQKCESKLKDRADRFIIPKVCANTIGNTLDQNNIMTYDGYKEDIYIADFKPNEKNVEEIPFNNYYIIRPEALASFYVKGKKSIVPDLINEFIKRDINMVLLPRDRTDRKFITDDPHIYIPDRALNGLDLVHFSQGVLTGSGTMAREAAVLGRPAVSFFPEEILLSVDQDMVDKGAMVHSRDVKEIVDHLLEGNAPWKSRDSRRVKKTVVGYIKKICGE